MTTQGNDAAASKLLHRTLLLVCFLLLSSSCGGDDPRRLPLSSAVKKVRLYARVLEGGPDGRGFCASTLFPEPICSKAIPILSTADPASLANATAAHPLLNVVIEGTVTDAGLVDVSLPADQKPPTQIFFCPDKRSSLVPDPLPWFSAVLDNRENPGVPLVYVLTREGVAAACATGAGFVDAAGSIVP